MVKIGTVIPQNIIQKWNGLGNAWYEGKSQIFSWSSDRKVLEIDHIKKLDEPGMFLSNCGKGLLIRLEGFVEFWQENTEEDISEYLELE